MNGSGMIPILYDGGRWMVVEKPAGLPTQAPSAHPSLESLLRDQLGDRASYLALPHRLDVPVGGVMLVALTKKSARLFSEQFATNKTKKTYEAIVAGDATMIPQVWNDTLAKIDGMAKVQLATSHQAGRSACTQVLDCALDPTHSVTRLVLQPVTGRMHQLRIGAASRGFPILGDTLYGASPTSKESEGTTENRIALKAISIEFHDPVTGRRRTFQCEPLSWASPQ